MDSAFGRLDGTRHPGGDAFAATVEDPRVRVFVPGPSSRFYPSVSRYLAARNFSLQSETRSLCEQRPGLDIFLARGFDIPDIVGSGLGDLGLTGVDVVVESGAPVSIVARLGIRWSSVVLASTQIERVEELAPNDLVLTEYPAMTAAYLERHGVKGVRLKHLSGGAECFAGHPEVRCVVTLTTSGATLVANRLRVLDTLVNTEACLILPDTPRRGVRERVEQLIRQIAGPEMELPAASLPAITTHAGASAHDSRQGVSQ